MRHWLRGFIGLALAGALIGAAIAGIIDTLTGRRRRRDINKEFQEPWE